MNKQSNIPRQYMGRGNQKKFYSSDFLARKITFEIDNATVKVGRRDCQVAELLGVSRQTYSRMKNQKTINMGNVEAIANVLGCDVEVKLVKRRSDDE